MSDNPAEFDGGELLRVIGKVPVPEIGILEDAREALWSAIAIEMLGIDPSGERPAATGGPARREEEHRSATRRRRTDRPQDERRKAMGGGDPDS
jgi:hypothetical protein